MPDVYLLGPGIEMRYEFRLAAGEFVFLIQVFSASVCFLFSSATGTLTFVYLLCKLPIPGACSVKAYEVTSNADRLKPNTDVVRLPAREVSVLLQICA